MGAVTISSGMYMSENDFGDSHVERHKHERAWKNFDDDSIPNIVILSDYDNSKSIKELSFEKAYELGLRTREQHEEHNRKIKPCRRRSYEEYVDGVSFNVKQGLTTQQKKSGDSRDKQRASMQLNLIKKNDGLAAGGHLYYISNVSDYENILEESGYDGLKRYREFEREVFRRFRESKSYKSLYSNEFFASIDTDELGAQHLQTAEVLAVKDKRGVVRIAPAVSAKNSLIATYGETTYNNLLYINELIKNDKSLSDKKPKELLALITDEVKNKVDKMGMRQKNELIKRSHYFAGKVVLSNTALEVSREMGVSWKRVFNTTKHKNKSRGEYVNLKAQEKLEEATQQLRKQKDITEQLTITKMENKALQDKLSKESELLDIKDKMVNHILAEAPKIKEALHEDEMFNRLMEKRRSKAKKVKQASERLGKIKGTNKNKSQSYGL